MARISSNPHRSITVRRVVLPAAIRSLLDARVMAHNPRVLRTYVREELFAERWSSVPAEVKSLAVLFAAATVGYRFSRELGFAHLVAVHLGPKITGTKPPLCC